MKKTLLILLAFAMLFSLCACGNDDSKTTSPSDSSQSTTNSAENSTGNTEAPVDGTEGTTGATQTPTDEPTTPPTQAPTDEPTIPPTQEPTETPTTPPTTSPTICNHSWKDATCTNPKTCKTCGTTDGSAAGHSWKDATCTTPKTCSKCSATEGNAAGHSWNAATCTAPKTCSKCSATEGNAAGHSWNAATCTAPKTCSKCNVTEGSAAGHSWNAATCTAPKTCSKCSATEGSAYGHSWKDATCTAPKTCQTCGVIDGSTVGHDYVQGICSVCGISVNDTNGPEITILSINPNPAKLGGEVTVRAKITDESGVKSADVQLCNSVGNVAGGSLSLVEGHAKDGIYEGTFTLPTDTPAGEWVANIYTRDVLGNTGLSWGDSNENFTVTGDVTDTSGPEITILSINPNPAKLGGEVTVRAKITDESGVKSADVQLCNSVGNVAGGSLSLVEGHAKDGIYEGTFTLPTDTPAGEWVANIYTRDVLGNTGLSWGDSNENFTVTGDVTDTSGPKITILSINPNPAKLGGEVTVRAKITDESGVKSADVQLCNSVGNVAGGNLSLVEGHAKDGIYEGTFTLPTDTPAGEWVANIYTRDIYGNTGLSWGDPNENFVVTTQ